MKRLVKSKLSSSVQKKVLFLLVLVLLVVVFNGVVRDWIAIWNNVVLRNKLQEEYKELQEEQVVLEQEAAKLQDPEYVLRYAREKYGYSKEGELIIRIQEENSN